MNKLNVISLGAGKQSSYMLINALEGKFKYRPDAAIFSDTGCEPKYVYEYLEWLKAYCKKNHDFDIITVTAGNLKQDVIDYVEGKKKRVAMLPLRLEADGMVMRQCTYDYKIAPTRRYLNTIREGRKVRLWIGISLDEMGRARTSNVKYIENYYPLIENRITIDQILLFYKKRGLPEPGKSACLICPFHSFEYWSIMRRFNRNEFEEACQFDDLIRNYPRLNKKAYLSEQRKPLREVDFSKHPSLFPEMIDECHGMCGL
jgi:hypothetical protein